MISLLVFFLPSYVVIGKGFSIQHALLTLIENWRKSLDNEGVSGAILMDLSKALDAT